MRRSYAESPPRGLVSRQTEQPWAKGTDLMERSADFRALWEQHEVAVRRFDRKRIVHPEVGLLHLTCEVLLTPKTST